MGQLIGGGLGGYATAFLAVGLVMLVMTTLTLGLKSRVAELDTAQHNRVVVDAQRA